MAKDLTKAMGNLPAHIAARMKTGTPSVLGEDLKSGLSQGGVPRISLKASRFRIVENGAEIRLRETELDVIIVGANRGISKTYYAKPWDPDDEPTAPDCFSMDGVYPDATVLDPPNDRCGTCPKNQWGSKLTPAGRQIKACADQKRLAVVAAGDPGTVYLVQVTPAALQGLAKYNAELKARGLEPNLVTTTLSFDSDASFPKLIFAFGGFPDDAAMDAVDNLDPDEIARVVTGDMSIGGPKPEPEVQARRPKQVEQADEEDERPEPKPKPQRRMARQPVEHDEPQPEQQVRAKPKPVPVDDEEDDDAALTAFAKRKPKEDVEVEAKPKRKPKPSLAVVENNDNPQPEPKADKRMSGLVDSISSRLSGMYADDEDEDDA